MMEPESELNHSSTSAIRVEGLLAQDISYNIEMKEKPKPKPKPKPRPKKRRKSPGPPAERPAKKPKPGYVPETRYVPDPYEEEEK